MRLENLKEHWKERAKKKFGLLTMNVEQFLQKLAE
jgi:hypothetical protein